MPMQISFVVTVFIMLSVFIGRPVAAQGPVPTNAPVRVFLDCNAPNCDFSHFRREIVWVTWARDREDSDVHLLLTAQQTGGGGWRYTLDYLGRDRFPGVSKSVTYVSDPDDTDAEIRDRIAESMALGLVQFAEGSPAASQLRVVYNAPLGDRPQVVERDPWNLWVFELSVSGSMDGEAQERSMQFEGGAEADRVSESHKINFEFNGEYDREEFDIDGSTSSFSSVEYSSELLVVWSLSDHWSAGGRSTGSRSTFQNRDLAVSGGPALEYNLFPYSESTRRQLTFMYAVELAYFDYELITVEGKFDEMLPRHVLRIAAEVQQPWGEIDGSVEGVQYLNDPAVHRIDANLNIEYRLFRGLGLDVFGRFSRIKDQFFLPNEGLTDEEILLERRQRETNFRFDVGIGLSYRFGSNVANVVNPRMNN